MGSVRKAVAFTLLAALALLSGPAEVLAQSSEPQRPPRNQTATREAEWPVSLERIRRELSREVRMSESRDGLRLSYYVEVYGAAPALRLFTPEENPVHAPVMYGGMTHQEFLAVVTPQEFRSPAADISSAIAALVKWAADKRKNAPRDQK